MASRLALSILISLVLTTYSTVVQSHTTATSSVSVDLTDDLILLALQIPIDQLQVAEPHIFQSPDNRIGSVNREAVNNYLQEHVSLSNATDETIRGRLATINFKNVKDDYYLIANMVFENLDKQRTNLLLNYDVIVHRVINHRAYVFLRSDFKNGVVPNKPVAVGTINFNNKQVTIHHSEGSLWKGFIAMMFAGAEHISNGFDHLLFLFCLLLPAPLVAINGRWKDLAPLSESIISIVHIVTAFTIGHSFTLALTAFDVTRLASSLVEPLVAISVLVAAIHALRPIIGQHNIFLATGFGLIHGLAFANEMIAHGLTTSDLVFSVVGFNIGIELMQLLMVLALMPCLLVIRHTSIYSLIRTGGAYFAVIAALCWIGERTLGMEDYLEGAFERLKAHWYWGYAVLVTISLVISILSSRLFRTGVRKQQA